MIEYREFIPDRQLHDYVGTIDTNAISYRVLPDCCCDILINLGDPINSSNTDVVINKHKAYIIGASTQFDEVSLRGSVSILGVRFKPLGLVSFIQQIPLGDFKNDSIDFELISKANFDLIFEKIDSKSILLNKQLDKVLLQLFNPNYHSDNTVRIVRNAIGIINQKKGILKVNELSNLVNTSVRNLERLFYRNIGLTPKEFSQITKLKSIKEELLANESKSLGQIAYEYDYYDNSHFTKDFITYAGVPPSKYF